MNSEFVSIRPRFESGLAIATLGTSLNFSDSDNTGKLEIIKFKKQIYKL